MASRIILDGGMGRELKRVGAPFRQPEWSALSLMQAPHSVVDVHRSFIQAGAQVITTNNYAVVPYHLGESQFEQDGMRLTALAGELARTAADEAGTNVRVGGSLPPLSGSYRPDWFDAELAGRLYPLIVDALEPYVDLWQAETMASIEEARCVVDALQNSDKPVWLSFSLTDDPSLCEPCLRSGESPADALQLALDNGADALLFNCCLPEVISQALALIAPLREQHSATLMLGAYGNTFTPRRTDAEANADEAQLRAEITPQAYREFTDQWQQYGAEIFGGCCGIGPEYIALLANRDSA